MVSLLRGDRVPGAVYRAVVAVAEGMQTRRGDLTSELVTKPLLEPLLRCLDSAGRMFSISFRSAHCNSVYGLSTCLNPQSFDTLTLVAVLYSAGFAIGRLRVRISAGATSHQGLLSLPYLWGR